MTDSTLNPYGSEILPNLGSKGSYELSTPFDAKVDSSVEYVCVGVETINSMVSRGIDVQQDIYLDNSIDASVYSTDAANNRSIITIQPTHGLQIRFPSSFLLGWPDNNRVRYSTIILGISLSAIADSEDLTVLKTEIADLIQSRFGIKSEVMSFKSGTTYLVTQSQHQSYVTARQTLITQNKSVANRLEETIAENVDLNIRIQTLQDYIAEHVPP